MNTISSIKTCRSSNKKLYTLSNFTLPSSLAFYFTVIEDEVDTDTKKVGEYVSKIWNSYYGTNMISTTEKPATITNTNIGSFILSDANNYIDFSTSINFNSAQSMTICFWFKLTSVAGNGSVKFPFRLGNIAFGNDVITPEFNYNSSGVLQTLFVYALANSGARFVGTNLNLLNWNHFTIIFIHGGVPQLYVNGSSNLYTSNNGTINFTSNKTTALGRMPHNTTTIPQSLITEIRVYREQLSTTRINAIYNWNGTGQPTY
jgi:hypothetical protein